MQAIIGERFIKNQFGRDINAKHPITLRTPLMEAVLYRNRPALYFLLVLLPSKRDGGHVPGIDERDRSGLTALHYAVKFGAVGIVKLLLKRNATYNVADMLGMTPLHWACRAPISCEILQVLIECGSNLEARDHKEKTPLHIAVTNHWCFNGLQAVEMLIQHKANLGALDNNQNTPLVARFFGPDHLDNTAIVMLLINNMTSTELDYRNPRHGNTALHYAILPRTEFIGNRYEITTALLQNNVNPDIQDDDGKTPLHLASFDDQKDYILLLMKYGANKKLADQFGFFPYEHYTVEAEDDVIGTGHEVYNQQNRYFRNLLFFETDGVNEQPFLA